MIDYGSLDKSIPGSFEVGFGAFGSWNSGNWAIGQLGIWAFGNLGILAFEHSKEVKNAKKVYKVY